MSTLAFVPFTNPFISSRIPVSRALMSVATSATDAVSGSSSLSEINNDADQSFKSIFFL